MNAEYWRYYLLAGLEATPAVLDHLLGGVGDPALYDRRPDPDRFTLREVLAHLADWEGVFHERLALTAARRGAGGPGAEILDQDEGRMAVEHDYAHADPDTCRRLFRERRQALAALLRGLSDDQWDLAAAHEAAGRLTVRDQATHVLGHDGYHLRQIAESLTVDRDRGGSL